MATIADFFSSESHYRFDDSKVQWTTSQEKMHLCWSVFHLPNTIRNENDQKASHPEKGKLVVQYINIMQTFYKNIYSLILQEVVDRI